MIKKLDSWIDKVCFYLLVVCLGTMLLISIASIILRWFQVSFLWSDPLVRHLVFLSAFLGGALATGQGNHIRIDLASKLFEKVGTGYQIWLARLLNLVSATTCIFLAKAGWDFAQMELQYGSDAFLGLKTGHMVFIITFGMGIIALRFFLRVLTPIEKEDV